MEGEREIENTFHAFDYLIVIDFEATCDEGLAPKVTRANQEIIEFPWVVYDIGLDLIVDSKQVYVKPEWNPELTEFCTQLTGITNETIQKEGVLLETAIRMFDEYVNKDLHAIFLSSRATSPHPPHHPWTKPTFCIVTDGVWDLQLLIKEARTKRIPSSPLITPSSVYKSTVSRLPDYFYRFYDLKVEFLRKNPQFAGNASFRAMLRYLHIPHEGRAHSGLDDSSNMAKIVATLIGNPSQHRQQHRQLHNPEEEEEGRGRGNFVPSNQKGFQVPPLLLYDYDPGAVDTVEDFNLTHLRLVQKAQGVTDKPTNILRVRGLPFQSREEDIKNFFLSVEPPPSSREENFARSGGGGRGRGGGGGGGKRFDTEPASLELMEDCIKDVKIIRNARGSSMGIAYVVFNTPEDASAGMMRNRCYLFSRYLELFYAAEKEMEEDIIVSARRI